MKKTLALLMLAALLLTGCGNNAMDGAKKDAQEAAQKVEQTANEAKDAANAKVDEAKDAANKAADTATAKVDEAKDAANQAADDAAAKVDEMKSDADKMANDMKSEAENVANDVKDALAVEGRTVALGGLMPGSTSLEDIQAMFGEATSVEGKVMTFVDGLKVTLDDANKVKEISTTGNSFDTPEGMYVGASEYSLNEYCGPADAVRQIGGGAEYEYFSGDKKSKVVYTAENGLISKITCSLK